MKKILIFGNGISLKYAPDEYSYESIKEKFIGGLKLFYERGWKNSVLESARLKSTKKEILDFIDFNKFNESTFFDVFKKLFIYNLSTNKTWMVAFDDEMLEPNDLFNKLYNCVLKNEKGIVDNSFIGNYFFIAFKALEYGIGRSLIINKKWNNWIQINYETNFLLFLKNNYTHVFTTNYYVGDLFDELNKNGLSCSYLHGQIQKNNKFSWLPDNPENEFKNYNQRGMELDGANVLFGRTYQDKIFLNSLIKWYRNETPLLREKINLNYSVDLLNVEVDVIGLSIQGDKHIIQKVCQEAKKINIYCYAKKDYIEWKEEVKEFLNKVSFHCSHTYQGFYDQEPNVDCPKLCKNKLISYKNI